MDTTLLEAEGEQDYITQILTGLAEIHRRGATQKRELHRLEDVLNLGLELDGESVVLAVQPASTVAKLASAGYARRIIDLHRSNPFLQGYKDRTPEAW